MRRVLPTPPIPLTMTTRGQSPDRSSACESNAVSETRPTAGPRSFRRSSPVRLRSETSVDTEKGIHPRNLDEMAAERLTPQRVEDLTLPL
jgi:hypothetical protein